MSDTTFHIELQGLDLPDEVKYALQSELRNVVVSRIAKTDLGAELAVEPLPESVQRMALPIRPILGWVIKSVGHLAERKIADLGPSLLFTPPKAVAEAQAMLANGFATSGPFDRAPVLDAVEALYYRPDVRSAISSNSRAFAEALGGDEGAAEVLRELIGGIPASTDGVERLGPLVVVGIVATAAYAGFVVGRLVNSRPQ